MKKTVALFLALCMVLSLMPATGVSAADPTFADEVPSKVYKNAYGEYEYLFGHNYVPGGHAGGAIDRQTQKVTSYEIVDLDITSPWKFANAYNLLSYHLETGSSISNQISESNVGEPANLTLAIYIPEAGKYKFDIKGRGYTSGGLCDVYFTKCPDDFTINSINYAIPSETGVFKAADKLADDVSFWAESSGPLQYENLGTINVESAGTYLVAFTGHTKHTQGNSTSIYCNPSAIKLTPVDTSFADEVPSKVYKNASGDYEYLFGQNYVPGGHAGGAIDRQTQKVTSYEIVDLDITSPWKFANAYNLSSYHLETGTSISNSIKTANVGEPANLTLAIYIPEAGKYIFDIMGRGYTTGGLCDVYFTKCPTEFTKGSIQYAIPSEKGVFKASDKLADDVSFWRESNGLLDYVTLGVIDAESAGTYLVAFTDHKKHAESSASDYLYCNPSAIKLIPLTAENNAISRVEAEISDAELMYGDSANITFTATRFDGTTIDSKDCTATYTVANDKIVSVSNTGVVTAKGHGTTDIKVKVSDGIKEVETKVTVTALDNSGVVANEVAFPDTLYVGDVSQMKWEIETAAGNVISLPMESVTVTPSEEGIVSVAADGMVTALKVGTVTLSLSATFVTENISAEKNVTVSKNYVAGEIPTADATKGEFEYVFAQNSISSEYVSIIGTDTSKVTTYSYIDSGKSAPWKFANVSGVANYGLDTANGVRVDTTTSASDTGANLSLALYVPKAGKYNVEFGSVTRVNGGTMDIYFSKCPDTFEVNGGGDSLIGENGIVKPSDKIGEDISFRSESNKIEEYRALDSVNISEAGTYLITFADFKKSEASTDDANISQSVTKIKLSKGFASEVPSNNGPNEDYYEYLFGQNYVPGGQQGGAIDRQTQKITSYELVDLTKTAPWKFANAYKLESYHLETGVSISNAISAAKQGEPANLALAIYIPKAGKYIFDLVGYGYPSGGICDVYFAKCPDKFTANSINYAIPSETGVFKASDKLADDVSFWRESNGLLPSNTLGIINAESAGTYLVAFTDHTKHANSTSSSIYCNPSSIKLTPFSDETNGVRSVEASIAKTELLNGEETQITWSAKRIDGSDLDPANCQVTYVPAVDGIVEIDENGKVTPIGYGKTEITVTVITSDRKASDVVEVASWETSGVASTEIIAPSEIIATETATLGFKATMNSGNTIDIPMETVTITPSVEGIVEILGNGKIRGLAKGEVLLTLSAEFVSEQISNEVKIVVTSNLLVDEVPTSFGPNKDYYEYTFGTGSLAPERVDAIARDPRNIKKYSDINLKVSAPWKYANLSALASHALDTSSTRCNVDVDKLPNNANLAFALYVPVAGEYVFELRRVGDITGGSLDVYFAKAPEDFVAGSAGGALVSENGPIKESDKIADDISFYAKTKGELPYEVLSIVNVPEPGAYIYAMAGHKALEESEPESGRYLINSISGIKLTPFTEEINGVYKIFAEADKTVLNYGETAQITWDGIIVDQSPVNKANCKVTYMPENTEIVSVDANGVVTAKGHGTTNVVVTVNDGKRTATTTVAIQAIDNTGVVSTDITGFASVTVTGKETFVWRATMNSGNVVKIPMDTVTATFVPDGHAKFENGVVTGISAGETVMTLRANFVGEELEKSIGIKVVPSVRKTEPSYYTYEMRENAQENIKKYTWARNEQKAAISNADAILPNLDKIIAAMVGEGIPRAEMPGTMGDAENLICKYCGKNVNSYPGDLFNCGWVIDIIRDPFKIKCPACSRAFPSNDFGKFYELGLDEHRRFDRMRALEAHRAMLIEKGLLAEEAIAMSAPKEENIAAWYKYYGYGVKGGYLNNDLYPEVERIATLNNGRGLRPGEKVELWGVDDGFGYKPRDLSGNVIKYEGRDLEECHAYVGTYLNWGYSYVIRYGGYLADAYLLTGDIKYGKAGAVLMDRVADLYPTYDVNRNQGNYYALTDGLTGLGHVRGRIHATGDSTGMCRLTDAFFPALYEAEVREAIAENSKKYNLGTDKSSAEAIWDYWEENILIHTYELLRTGRADGNFGMPQATMAMAAIATNREPYTSMMLDWILASNDPKNDVAATSNWLSRNGNVMPTGPLSEEVTIKEGGDFNATMVDDVDRDGFPNEVSFFYNGVRLTNLQNVTEAMAHYTGEKEYNLYTNPKYIALHEAFLKTPLTYSHQPNLGDGLDIAIKGFNLDLGAYKKFFQYTDGYEDIKKQTAILLYISNNNSADKYKYDIYTKDPERLITEIEEYAAEIPKQPSTLLAGYGFAALRDGYKYEGTAAQSVDNQRDMWLFFGRNEGHSQSSIFHLGMDAYGLNIAPDNGYPTWADTSPETLQWNTPSIAHNTVFINEKNVGAGTYINGLPLHFDDSESVKLVDVRHPGASEAASEYRRTLVMVKVDDDSSYGLDFFRITGGNTHTYSFHAQAENATGAEGLNLIKQADEDGNYIGSYAGYDEFYDKSKNDPAVVGDSYYDENPDAEDMKGYWPVGKDPNSPAQWKYETVYPRGYTWLGKVRRDENPAEKFAVEFDIEDYRNYVKNGDKIGLRVTQLNNFTADEVALAAGPKATRSGNKDLPDTFDYMLVKREGENLDSLFTTVYEPYMETRYLENIEDVAVTVDASSEAEPAAGDMVKAVKVTHKSGRVDYVVYASNNKVTYNVGGEFIFRGFVGMVTKNADGEVIDRYVSDGDIVVDKVADIVEYTGKVEDFTRELEEQNFIDITLNEEVEVSELVGKHIYINVEHEIENGVYLIKGAEEIDGGMIRLDIGNVSLIRSYRDSLDFDKGYVYNISRGNTFRIPLTYAEDLNPTFSEVQDGRVSVGSMYNQVITAEGKNGAAVTIEGRTLPRGATFDAATGTFSWKPTTTQVGANHISLTATDEFGRETTVHFTVEVLGSVSGGGGGGGDTPSTDKPDEPEEPTDEPDEPTVEPDEPGTDEPTEGGDVAVADGFVDLDNHAWATDAINYLADEGIIKGTSETTFSPASNITRADYAILLVRAF
ncbi:MAG: S-layer homology domain-containing protein, partial [Oscillospiraceae bacterium]|nr:S-layer homology domain-containing protein [Oscillospiraceae bacterium]